MTQSDFDNEDFKQTRSQSFAFGEEGDFIQGALIDVKQVISPQNNEPTFVYDFLIEKAVSHRDGAEVEYAEGDVAGVWEHWGWSDKILPCRVGQRMTIKFDHEQESTKRKGKSYKVYELFVPKHLKDDKKAGAKKGDPLMNKEWMEQNGYATHVDCPTVREMRAAAEQEGE